MAKVHIGCKITMEILLTKKQIERDIETYQDRLSKAEAKLSGLPGRLWGRKLTRTRRALLSEIKHVKTLTGYAQEALAEMID
jgi:hypothetical protein